MYNLYSITRSQVAMRRLLAITRDLTGNLPPIPGLYPDQPAPIVASDGEGRRLKMMRWSMPGPPQSKDTVGKRIGRTHLRRSHKTATLCLPLENRLTAWPEAYGLAVMRMIYPIVRETFSRARQKVELQRAKLSQMAADDPLRHDEERVLATMIENATIAGLAEAFEPSE